MKKVALIHYRLINKGGLERRLINYMHYFSNNGYQVTVFATRKDDSISLPKNVHFVRVSIGPIPKYFRALFFAKKIKRIMPKYSFDISLSLGRTLYQTNILDAGNHYGYMQCLGYKNKSLKDHINLYLDRTSFACSRHIFACSNMVKNFNIEGYGTYKEKIKVAYPPANVQQFNQDLRSKRSELRTLYNLKENVLTFLFISTGHKMKNLSFLLKLFAALDKNRYELIIAGSKPKSKLPENVRFIGFAKEPQKIYTAVDYTIHPALYEPFGQVIVESILCGTPVILSHQVGAKELITENEGIVISSFNINDWIQVIQNLESMSFAIDPNFATDQKLTIDQHMDILLNQ